MRTILNGYNLEEDFPNITSGEVTKLPNGVLINVGLIKAKQKILHFLKF